MASKAETLLRQQYLVPRKSVRKLRELSRLKGVSAGELARRAIEAYLSGDVPQNPEDERAALSLLEEIHAKVAATLSRIEHLKLKRCFASNTWCLKRVFVNCAS